VGRALESKVRQSGIKPADFAEECRVLPGERSGPWTFDGYEYLRKIHNDPGPRVVVRKGAQMGFTETMINRMLHFVAVRHIDTLYVLPTADDARDFSAARFNVALRLSPYLRDLFTDVSNVHHKLAGTTNLYIRGSNSKARLASIPVGAVFIDEYDLMNASQVGEARERISGHKDWFEMDISTPTVDGYGIDGEYSRSDQRCYMVTCPHCDKHITLSWPGSVEWRGEDPKTARYKCSECGHPLTAKEKAVMIKNGFWYPLKPKNEYRGYTISQLYSPTVSPADIVGTFLAAQTNPIKMQIFYNFKLGLPFVAEGARLTDELIDAAIAGYSMRESSAGSVMGVDVGGYLYYEIAERVQGRKRVIKAGHVTDFADIASLMKQYNVRACVIDWQPETRLVRQFQVHHPGVWLARYTSMREQLKIRKVERMVDINRTEAIDWVFQRYRSRTVDLPADLPREYREHMKAPVRVLRQFDNVTRAVYVEGSLDDHLVHASVYAEVALALLPPGDTYAAGRPREEIHEPAADGEFEIFEELIGV